MTRVRETTRRHNDRAQTEADAIGSAKATEDPALDVETDHGAEASEAPAPSTRVSLLELEIAQLKEEMIVLKASKLALPLSEMPPEAPVREEQKQGEVKKETEQISLSERLKGLFSPSTSGDAHGRLDA